MKCRYFGYGKNSLMHNIITYERKKDDSKIFFGKSCESIDTAKKLFRRLKLLPRIFDRNRNCLDRQMDRQTDRQIEVGRQLQMLRIRKPIFIASCYCLNYYFSIIWLRDGHRSAEHEVYANKVQPVGRQVGKQVGR